MSYSCVSESFCAGAGERFAKLQLCVHPGTGQQPKLCIVFRGTGHYLERERAAYHKSVVVLCQEHAWVCKPVVNAWVDLVLAPFMLEHNPVTAPWALFQDQMFAQKSGEYVRKVKALNGECAYGPRGASQFWQPIDVGPCACVSGTYSCSMGFRVYVWCVSP